MQIALYAVLQWSGSREFGPRVKMFGTPGLGNVT